MFQSKEAAANYLAGIIDGEGSVRASTGRDLRVTNTDADILAATREAFDLLGIAFRVYVRTDRAERADVYGSKSLTDIVVSTRAGLESILSDVPLRCGYKFAKLQKAISLYTRYGQLPDRDEFARIYAERGQRGAAAYFKVSSGTIFNWRKRFGIAAGRRPRQKQPPFDLEELACLLDQGASLLRATEILGIPYSTARYWIKQVAKDPEMVIGWVRRALLGEDQTEGDDPVPS